MEQRSRRRAHHLATQRINRFTSKNDRIRPHRITHANHCPGVTRLRSLHRHAHQPWPATQRLIHRPQHRRTYRKNPGGVHRIRQRLRRFIGNSMHIYVQMAGDLDDIAKPLVRLLRHKHICCRPRGYCCIDRVFPFHQKPPRFTTPRRAVQLSSLHNPGGAFGKRRGEIDSHVTKASSSPTLLLKRYSLGIVRKFAHRKQNHNELDKCPHTDSKQGKKPNDER